MIQNCGCATQPRIIMLRDRSYGELLSTPAGQPAALTRDSPAWLFYTSGTTGNPKGAVLSHGNLLTMTSCYFTGVDQIAAGDAIVHAAPMSHGSGLYMLPHIAHAAVNVIPESGGFQADELIALLRHYPGASLFAAPTMVKRLVSSVTQAADVDNLKTLVYGGGPMYLADLDRAHEVLGFRLAQIYGQGESPMTITSLDKAQHGDTGHPRYRERLASVGVAQAGVELAVVDSHGRRLPSGEAGEVLVRGPSVMLGYWRNEAATHEALRDGWLHTGDVGRLDADGFLTLVDRSKDMIISGGSNIYPREVEEVLLRHPAVTEVAVVGCVDEEWGERVVAFVVADPVPPEAELDQHCLRHMARFKRPRRYVWRDSLPKNHYGKVLKRELRGDAG